MISGLLSNALAEEASATKLEAWLAHEAPDVASDDVRELAELLGKVALFAGGVLRHINRTVP